MKQKSLTLFPTEKVFLTTALCCVEDGCLGYSGTVEWQSALSLQYHVNTANWKHQLPFIVNFDINIRFNSI